jgi:BirA family biotin operon repressor/biotin-[acetyl-CoA-carboxylase] ligase
VKSIHADGSSRIGNTIWFAKSLESTSIALRDLAANKWAGHGAVVWADKQTAGRGRLGRQWESPAGGGLFVSALVCGIEPPILYSMVALAVRDAIFRELGVASAIKWPNDVLVDGRKVSGILIEVAPEGAIIGIGVNTNMSTEDLARIGPEAMSLRYATGRPIDHRQLLERLLVCLEEQYVRGSIASHLVFEDWKAALVTLGQTVEVQTTRETWLGHAVDVAIDGSLLVLNDKRLVRVYAADVRIRPK